VRYFVCFGVFWRLGRKSPSARWGRERSDVTMCVDAQNPSKAQLLPPIQHIEPEMFAAHNKAVDDGKPIGTLTLFI
jgi:hypothetical protein